MERDSFIFYRSFFEAIDEVDEATQLIVYRSIAVYALNREEPKLEGIAKVLWRLIKPQLDANWTRFENGCKGAEHGVKGGNPNFKKGQPNPYYNKDSPKDNPNITPKITPNENDNVFNDNVNDNENVNKKNAKKEKNILPDYVSTDLADVMRDWLEYKREKGESYKPRGLKACYNKLVSLSGGNAEKARAIIEQSMSNNYAGLFSLKNQDNGYEHTYRRTPQDNIIAAQQAHIRAIADSISKTTERNGEVSKFLPFG